MARLARRAAAALVQVRHAASGASRRIVSVKIRDLQLFFISKFVKRADHVASRLGPAGQVLVIRPVIPDQLISLFPQQQSQVSQHVPEQAVLCLRRRSPFHVPQVLILHTVNGIFHGISPVQRPVSRLIHLQHSGDHVGFTCDPYVNIPVSHQITVVKRPAPVKIYEAGGIQYLNHHIPAESLRIFRPAHQQSVGIGTFRKNHRLPALFPAINVGAPMDKIFLLQVSLFSKAAFDGRRREGM